MVSTKACLSLCVGLKGGDQAAHACVRAGIQIRDTFTYVHVSPGVTAVSTKNGTWLCECKDTKTGTRGLRMRAQVMRLYPQRLAHVVNPGQPLARWAIAEQTSC
eukprot:1161541-Pelagomonas_calceolata.AAC.5